MSKIFGGILKFMTPWRRWAGPAAVCAAPAAVEIGGELLRGLQEPDALLRPALAAVALAASAAALARRRCDEVGMFPPLLRAADGGKSAARAPRRQGPGSLAAAETSPRAGIAKKGGDLIGGSGKKGALTGAQSGGMTEAESRRVVLDYLDHHPEVIAQVEQGLPYDKHGKRSMADQQILRNVRNGDAAELYGLSERFEHGEQGKRGKQGVQQNKELAAKLRLFAAEGGHKEAQFKYGKMCEWDSDPIRRNNGEAEDFYRRAAEQGHVGAMFTLGRLLYRKKDASPQDLAEAEKWLRIAAEYGEARAQYMLVHMYVSGMGVGLSQEDAREWMRSHSTKIGYTPSLQLFDRSSNSPAPVESSGEAEADEPPDAADAAAPSDPANAKSEEEKDLAVRAALKSAMWALIRPLPREKPMKKDGENDQNAARCMKTLGEVKELLEPELKAWEAETAAARAKMGMPEAETPPTIPQEYEAAGRRFNDLRAALRWVKPAADDSAPRTLADKLATIKAKILPEAERRLAERQEKNRVLTEECDAQREKNGTLAEHWLTRAANQGHAESQFYLGYLYYNDICVQKDRTKASEWWRRAADQGHPHAQFELGLMYGPSPKISRPPDDDGADTNMWWTWLRNAAEQGHLGAQVELRMRYAEPPGTRKQNWEEAYLMCHLAAETGDEMAIHKRKFYLEQISEQRQHAVIRKAEELHKKMVDARKEWQEKHDALWGARGNQMWQWWFPLPSDDSSGGQPPSALPAPPPSEE